MVKRKPVIEIGVEDLNFLYPEEEYSDGDCCEEEGMGFWDSDDEWDDEYYDYLFQTGAKECDADNSGQMSGSDEDEGSGFVIETDGLEFEEEEYDSDKDSGCMVVEVDLDSFLVFD